MTNNKWVLFVDGEWYMTGTWEQVQSAAALWYADDEPHEIIIGGKTNEN